MKILIKIITSTNSTNAEIAARLQIIACYIVFCNEIYREGKMYVHIHPFKNNFEDLLSLYTKKSFISR